MPTIYRCTLTLMEPLFFSSREVGGFYQTEALIGNYALAYAFGLCHAPYHQQGGPRYREDLTPLREAGIYVTPATFDGTPRYTQGEFNAQPDTYWYAMGNNLLVTRLDGTWAEGRLGSWYILEREGDKGRKLGVDNRPQHGRIRYLAIGNKATCFVISERELQLPRYIRLGKWMSKARADIERIRPPLEHREQAHIPRLLNPLDLPGTLHSVVWDTVNVPPVPLIRNLRCSGECYVLGKNDLLPAGMRFNI